ncbi:MAG: ferrochelatase [Chloroflexi bacterium]|nr:MAG: ferrochelatase [Chloroflexota bacterium]
MTTKPQVGVILMTYGSPATLDDIPEYIKRVYGGREVSPEVITEFRRRYALIGGSPLIQITHEQAAALAEELNAQHPQGPVFHAVAGMRFSPPFIADAAMDAAAGAHELVGVIMSPQYSPIIMSGYIKHSMPKRVIEREPDYINHLKETAAAVAELVGLPRERWMFCYQSAGHTPEEWLKPDFADVMPELRAAGHTDVLIAPVQFLADHLEILYDIEIGAREQAEQHGIHFARIESLNTSPLFIKALAEVVKETMTSPVHAA